MARSYLIDEAMQQLGRLYAGEHAEHDDEGAAQIDGLIHALRRFKKHEQQEQTRRQQANIASGL